MRNLLHLLLAFSFIFTGGCVVVPAPRPAASGAILEERDPVTILISIDGFHPSYRERGITPNLDRLAVEGVSGPMRPSFPTKTFPNHYTIVTGLRPDRHGIVDNAMEDAARPNRRFSLGNAGEALDAFWWNQAEPIWVTAERAGIRTATMFWPGSEVAIRGVRPRSWVRFDQNVTGAQRVETLVDWLRRPAATRPRFLTLYFDTVDTAGHEHGPAAAETNAAIADVDARIGDLVAQLEALAQPANIVIVSDHGMAATAPARVVPLPTLVDPALISVVQDGPYLTANPLPGQEAAVARSLLRPHQHVQCWRRETLPARFQYGRNPRVPAFFCLAETGWTITNPAREPYFGGAHGFDNEAAEMRATFIASGPAFRSGVTLPLFDNVHVYPLLARLIGVEPLPSQADPAALAAAWRR